MTADLGMLIVIGGLYATGVYLLLERSLIRMLLGLLLMGNATNLLLLTVGGGAGNPPIVGRISGDGEHGADPLAQAMILTAIVITMGVGAFVLALAYRSYTISKADDVDDDTEDTKVSTRRTAAEAPDHDRSDDPVTGAARPEGDSYGPDHAWDRL
ncbi:Na(+)/H(+) antiporter subunit C [Rhodococcus sp. D2-41]|nr:Na(+)/H(+) antiporter subunit C [Rhodococcus sp. D2-41]